VFTQELAKELRSNGTQVRVFAPYQSAHRDHHLFPRYLPRMPHSQHLSSLLVHYQLERLIVTKQVKRLFVNSGPGGILLLNKPSVPTVVYAHVTYSQSIRFTPQARWKKIFLPWEKRTYQLADLVLTNSLSTHEELISYYNVPKDKIKVIYPGVAGTVKSLPYEERDPYSLIFVGRLVHRKGIETLLRSFEQLKPTLPSLKLRIIGNGSEKKAIQKWIQRNSFHDSVTLCGYLPKKEIYNELKKSLIALTPSIYEGFGLVAVEALRAGTPVIASNVSGLREIVHDGENGLLIQARSSEELTVAIQKLCTNEALWKDLSANAQPSSEKFSWSEFVRRLCN
jgi:glycosyltransferase involved in cell wall biosynthesis